MLVLHIFTVDSSTLIQYFRHKTWKHSWYEFFKTVTRFLLKYHLDEKHSIGTIQQSLGVVSATHMAENLSVFDHYEEEIYADIDRNLTLNFVR